MDPVTNIPADDELVLRFQQGDGGAFEELVFRYKNALYQYILAMVQDEGAAGDLFQDVFVRFYQHADQYRPQGKFKAWLFRLARNRTLNYFREDKPASLDAPDEEGAALQDKLAEDSPLPPDMLENKELGLAIRRAALRLPVKQRETLYLRQYLSFKEIAGVLDRPLGTVLADFHRAVKTMQTLLLKEDVL